MKVIKDNSERESVKLSILKKKRSKSVFCNFVTHNSLDLGGIPS